MKLFKTSNSDTVKTCQLQFTFDLPSVIIEKRAKKFKDSLTKVNYTYTNHARLRSLALLAQHCVHCYLPLWFRSYQLYTSLFC